MSGADWVGVIIAVVVILGFARIIYVTLWLTGHVDDSEKLRKLSEKKLRKKFEKLRKEHEKGKK